MPRIVYQAVLTLVHDYGLIRGLTSVLISTGQTLVANKTCLATNTLRLGLISPLVPNQKYDTDHLEPAPAHRARIRVASASR